VHKRTETLWGTIQLRAFTPLPASSAALVPSAPPARRIEIIGDSITCGYGDQGDSATCPFTADTEDESMAYGARAARLLGAAHTRIDWSGLGLTRNYGGATKDIVPALWERTIATDPASRWPFAAPPPDVVVVNLGSNDFSVGDPGRPFQDALVAFIGRIRA